MSSLDQLPGADVFQAVVEIVRDHPNLSTGAVLEWFRDTEHQAVVQKLVLLSDPATDRDVGTEFDDLLINLKAEARRARVEWLRQKPDPTAEEKAELARLLAEKGKSRDFSHHH